MGEVPLYGWVAARTLPPARGGNARSSVFIGAFFP